MTGGALIVSPQSHEVAPGAIYVRLELETGAGKLQQIPTHEYFVSLEHEIYADGQLGRMVINLFDKDFDYIEKLVVAGKGRGRVQYGWIKGPKSKTREFIVYQYKPKFEALGLHLQLAMTDKEIVPASNEKHIRSFPDSLGTTFPIRISDIVKKIMQEDGYSEFDIEPTVPLANSDTSDVVFRQQSLTNLAFIQNVLKYQARSEKTGQGAYKFGIDGGRVYFKPFSQNPKVKRRYLFNRDPKGSMRSWEPQVNGTLFLAQGGGLLKVESWDPAEKKMISKEISIDDGESLAIAEGTIAGKPEKGYAGRHTTLPFDNKDRVEWWAIDRYTRAREAVVTAHAQTLGDPELYPLDYVEVIVLKTDKTPHYLSGGYFTTKVVNRIARGEFLTDFDCVADGSKFGDTKNKGIPINVSEPPNPNNNTGAGLGSSGSGSGGPGSTLTQTTSVFIPGVLPP